MYIKTKVIDKNLEDYRFWFIFMIFIPNGLCSLLSRLKNRYEYIPQQNNVYTFTDDLYDFEFTSIFDPTFNVGSENNYEKFEIKTDEVNLTDDSRIKKFDNYGQNIEFNSGNNNLWSYASSSHVLSYRPTIRFSSTSITTTIKRRKTLATYFPRKTLPVLTTNIVVNITVETETLPTRTQENTENKSLLNWTTKHKNQLTGDSSIVTRTKYKPIRTSIVPIFLRAKNVLTKSINATNSKSKTIFLRKSIKRQSAKSWCYRCGLNETRIPMPYCYDIFTGSDQSLSSRRNRFKVKCIKSSQTKQIRNAYYGPWFRGGCFKRFLDVGTEYTERGCRTFKPMKGKSFASLRFVKLESVLNEFEDGCVVSPHASITPFSRAISLYARYHVCVCSQKYCNNCNILHHLPIIQLQLFYFIFY